MILHVTQAEYRGGYRIWLRFSDGTEGEADLTDHLDGPVFKPLRDRRAFARLRLDPELDTVVWENGADLAPEYLRQLVRDTARRPRRTVSTHRPTRKRAVAPAKQTPSTV
ncbi:MAG: DUF2442 domain-containing protein [Phycisphaerae bacterium]|nr:DUF2442 domain-containing protein [Phycisphaerae bacterium]